MSRTDEAVKALRQELLQVVATKEALEKKIDDIKRQLEIIESLSAQSANRDLLRFKD